MACPVRSKASQLQLEMLLARGALPIYVLENRWQAALKTRRMLMGVRVNVRVTVCPSHKPWRWTLQARRRCCWTWWRASAASS